MDEIFWIASCTKLIRGITAPRLVEQDNLTRAHVGMKEDVYPELKDSKVPGYMDEYDKSEFVDIEDGIK